jgi:hypothetical protein
VLIAYQLMVRLTLRMGLVRLCLHSGVPFGQTYAWEHLQARQIAFILLKEASTANLPSLTLLNSSLADENFPIDPVLLAESEAVAAPVINAMSPSPDVARVSRLRPSNLHPIFGLVDGAGRGSAVLGEKEIMHGFLLLIIANL